jgi:hypothetical protein
MDFHKIFDPEYLNEYFTALFNEINNLILLGTHLKILIHYRKYKIYYFLYFLNHQESIL